MTIHVHGLGYVKHFNAICPHTKMAFQMVYKAATSKNAADFLKHVIKSLPFKVKSIQVDGGSEFRSHFEQACEINDIPLYVTPPRSPECNGHVERINGTFKYEFYSQYQGTTSIHILRYELLKFTRHYHKIRPHEGLGYLTPHEFCSSLEKVGGQSQRY